MHDDGRCDTFDDADLVDDRSQVRADEAKVRGTSMIS